MVVVVAARRRVLPSLAEVRVVGEPDERRLSRVFLCVVEILAVVPEPRLDLSPVHRHDAGPGCAAT